MPTVLARLEAGALDRLHHHVERRLVGRQHRREAALVAHRGGEAHLAQHLLERVEDLHAHPQPVGERVGADRHHHELLGIHVVGRVRAAVEDVHHRHRHARAPSGRRDSDTAAARSPAPPPGPRPATPRGSRWRRGCPCWACRRRPSSRASTAIWSVARSPSSRGPITSFTFLTACSTPLPPYRFGVAVAQLDRLVLAGGRATRHGRAPRARRWTGRPRPRRWDCPGCRGFRVHALR